MKGYKVKLELSYLERKLLRKILKDRLTDKDYKDIDEEFTKLSRKIYNSIDID